MIVEAVLSVIMLPVATLVSGINFILPLIHLPSELVIGFTTLFGYINWLFPISAIAPLIILKLALGVFNIGWKFILRLKSFIPTMGN